MTGWTLGILYSNTAKPFLYGIDKKEVIPYIDKDEFIQAIRIYACSFRERIKRSQDCLGSQTYGILTICRAFYTIKTGAQTSKLAAALWAMDFLPEYRELITNP